MYYKHTLKHINLSFQRKWNMCDICALLLTFFCQQLTFPNIQTVWKFILKSSEISHTVSLSLCIYLCQPSINYRHIHFLTNKYIYRNWMTHIHAVYLHAFICFGTVHQNKYQVHTLCSSKTYSIIITDNKRN